MKLITLLLSTFLGAVCVSSYAQNDSSPYENGTYYFQYSKEEIDSLLPTVRTYYFESNYEKIIEELPSLLENAKRVGANNAVGRFQSILGNSFVQLEDYEQADSFFQEILEESIKNQDTLEVLSSYVNLGNTYIIQDPEKSISYFESGINYIGETEDYEMVQFILHNNLAELYVGIESPDKAQFHLDKAFPHVSTETLGNRKDEAMATLYHVQGAISLLKGNYKEAIDYTNKSIEAKPEGMEENYLLGNYKTLLGAYDKTGRYAEVNEIRKLYDSLKDKRYEKDKIKQEQIAKSKYNVDTYKRELRESQLEIALSEQTASENKLRFLLTSIISAILILFIAALLFGRRKRNNLLKNIKRKNKQYLAAKEKSEKLAQSNTRFLSTISHELRTPLYGIIGLSSVLLKNAKLDEHQEHVESLKFSADYLLALVNDVLHINKFESKEGQVLKKEHFVIRLLIQSIVQSFEFINKKNNNNIHISIDPDIPTIVVCDKTKLSQVLMNLLSNASKFTEDGDIYVTLKAKKLESDKLIVLFSIRDTGVGIPADEQTRIFEEFTQVRKNDGHGGTGLGLPIVNRILNIMGSKLHFESTLGEGTIFSFEKAVISGSQEQLEMSIDAPQIDNLKGKTVLIVDDNKINQLVTQKVLEQLGMKHGFANNGMEAVQMVKENPYDVVLMDINMPIMDGIEASQEIRKFNSDVPIIALTATNYEKGDDRLLNHGINDTIVKPYNTEELVRMLLKNVDQSKKILDLFKCIDNF